MAKIKTCLIIYNQKSTVHGYQAEKLYLLHSLGSY